jgi:UDP-glucose 4-epimerase
VSSRAPSVAVVGGAGFIGSHVVELLVARGHPTLIIDDMSHPCVVEPPAQAEVLIADGGGTECRAALERFRPAALIHLAAKGGVNRALRDPAGHVTTVLAQSVGCFEAATAAGCATIVIASSGGAVYGDAAELPAAETATPSPRSAYGAEKLSEETYLWTHRRRGVRTVALRYGNVYGPRQHGTGEAGVVAITATRLAAGRAPIIYGTGEQTRDFVFVADVAGATVMALDGDASGPINVGTGVESSVDRVVELLRASFPGAPPAERLPAREGEVGRGALDSRRAAGVLGWRPTTDLESGLRLTAAYFGAPDAASLTISAVPT